VCRDGAGAASLRLVTLDGAEVSVLHEGDATLGDPAFSPDGTRIVFFAGDDAAVGDQIWSIDADGSARVSCPPRRARWSTPPRGPTSADRSCHGGPARGRLSAWAAQCVGAP
jgi:Tol biopolymer transport system component